MRGATPRYAALAGGHYISIHAPHAGRDTSQYIAAGWLLLFQSTRPMRGATIASACSFLATKISIHAPHAGRDSNGDSVGQRHFISIHAPHAGRDFLKRLRKEHSYISIHAPHAGRDPLVPEMQGIEHRISIHAPHAGRDHFYGRRRFRVFISIHAPHAGRDTFTVLLRNILGSYFNPRAPCGARRGLSILIWALVIFQSTRPMRGATFGLESLEGV